MGLIDDILGKLVDINLKVDPDQMGVVNVKMENKTFNYNIHISDPETAKAFARIDSTRASKGDQGSCTETAGINSPHSWNGIRFDRY